ncbi:AAA family ATPase [Apiospora marii]|uniref:AAA family ATPase n=1 Tax=Apiospora marii TaxID=335849 RepID=UPI00313262BE
MAGATEMTDVSARQMQEISSSGIECDVQTLYPGPPKCNCCTNWVEEYPENLKSSVEEQPESKRKALVVRMGLNHGEGKPLALHSIVVQNQHIKDLLGDVFQGYGGITTTLNKLVFRAPFHPFYYRWTRFQSLLAQKKQEDAGASAYSQLLYNILQHELKETMEEANDMCAKGVITYKLLWAIFEPGTRVYSTLDGLDQFYLVRSSDYDPLSGCFRIVVFYTDHDGYNFGFATFTLDIPSFEETKDITSLNVHPTSFRDDEGLLEAALWARGKRFYDLRGVQYKGYLGSCFLCDEITGRQNRKELNGRIVIDASLSISSGAFGLFRLLPLDDPSVAPTIDVVEQPRHQPPGRPVAPQPGRPGGPHPASLFSNPYPEDGFPGRVSPVIVTPKKRRKAASKPLQVQTKSQVEPSEEQLMLSNGSVRGYSLADKKLGLFSVDSVENIHWNEDAFPNLRLPEGHKDLILAFVDGQLSDSQPFDDIIQGKGLGLTMLLVGSPGTGKTLRPRHAGELGQSASSVESKLETTLMMTEKWGAILLLDECDVFLEKRSHSHLGHNEVVAVFLRTLEYYPGMLFLTTNRGDAIDAAFQSRIHLTLHYPELSTDAKYHIWGQFLSRAATSAVNPFEMSKLADLSLNGRQIKNIVKTASLLARSQGSSSVQFKHIETVLKVTSQEGQNTKQRGLDYDDVDDQVALSGVTL